VAVKPVLRFPHPSLKQVARALGDGEAADAERVARDLVDTMRAFAGCLGIAAPQVDELVRVIVVDVSEHPKAESANGLLLLVNPRVVEAEGSEIGREGCLSIPELTANVRRATRVVVEARTPSGDERVVDAVGFEARCLQHELDHLDGILFLDRVESLERDVFKRKQYG
jgi:peptide deformylase